MRFCSHGSLVLSQTLAERKPVRRIQVEECVMIKQDALTEAASIMRAQQVGLLLCEAT
jgi:hypothetical protein